MSAFWQTLLAYLMNREPSPVVLRRGDDAIHTLPGVAADVGESQSVCMSQTAPMGTWAFEYASERPLHRPTYRPPTHWREIHPPVPDSARVSGFIYETEAECRGEDMIDVLLANEILITAGWYPEGDPNGSYLVQVSRGCELIAERHAETADLCGQAVSELATEYSR